MQPTVIYRVDGHDCIRFVNADWNRFAVENDAPHLAEQLTGQPLWRYISGMEVAQLYREVLRKVREDRRRLAFPFRCDSPTVRRDMLMEVSPHEDRHVEFRCQVVATTPKSHSLVLPPTNADAMAGLGLLRICSWCKRLKIEERWVELDIGIRRLHLLAGDELPQLTHGICDRCTVALERSLSDDEYGDA